MSLGIVAYLVDVGLNCFNKRRLFQWVEAFGRNQRLGALRSCLFIDWPIIFVLIPKITINDVLPRHFPIKPSAAFKGTKSNTRVHCIPFYITALAKICSKCLIGNPKVAHSLKAFNSLPVGDDRGELFGG
jgi:hypothetical protein